MSGLKDVKDYYRRLPDEKYALLSKVSHQHNILDVIYGGGGVQNPSPAWTYEISPGIAPVDQQHTGRCWIFSALSVHNHLFRTQYAINNSKATFSEAYIGFWDLFEKARLFLQLVFDHKDDDLEENASLADLIKTGIQDGGDYFFAMNIMEKYGVVPTEFYPNRTYGTAATESLLTIINQILRDDAIVLRETGDKRKIKPMMHNIFALLVISFGLPPEPWKSLNWSIEQNEGFNYYAGTVDVIDSSTIEIVDNINGSDVVVAKTEDSAKVVDNIKTSSALDGLLEEMEKTTGTLSPEDIDKDADEARSELSDAASTVKVESEIEDNIRERNKERKEITIESPTESEDAPVKSCSDKFEGFWASLVRPSKCSCTRGCPSVRTCNSDGQMRSGCQVDDLQKLAYRKKSKGPSEKKLTFDYTPIQLYEKFIATTRFTPLLCDPRYPKGTYLILNDTNMLGGMESKYLNVGVEEMAYYAVASLKLNIPVFFAADVKKDITPDGGKLNPDDKSMENILPELHIVPSQKKRIEMYNAMATHAMVLSAVSLSGADKPEWWRVVNSWGDVGARSGMFILSHEWFKRHVYSINIPSNLLVKKHRTNLKSINVDAGAPSVI